MFSTLRNRFGIPGVISVIALVFAMLGGAYAASSNDNGKATASAKAKKGPRGPKGATGPAGPVGPQGPAGAAGAKGDAGANGATGGAGPTGPTGLQGNKGAAGAQGPPGAAGATGFSGFTETLPSGKSETGTWSLSMPTGGGEDSFIVPISFPIPLAKAGLDNLGTGVRKAFYFTSEQVELGEFEVENIVTKSMEDSGCRWELENANAKPEATTPGTLCVFAQVEEESEAIKIRFFKPPGADAFKGYGPSGSHLRIIRKATVEPVQYLGFGTWAVTAP
ncbi:MAG: hypothetical protein QOF85_1212 [Solirubrobacterales bacterium]|jgi:hypothetical protein|nr:hypothetical protein [Solirubrobacterales bacterium]